MGTRYLFLSARSAVGINSDSIAAIKKTFGSNLLALNVGQGGQYWSNGFVSRFDSSMTLKEWRAWLSDEFREIAEFWLFHDAAGNAIDNMNDGPGAMSLAKLGSKSICQLFLRYEKHDVAKGKRVQTLLADFEKHGVNCRYAFDFSNGSVHFLTSMQASQTIYRRCQGALRESIEFTLIDPLGVCFGSDGEMDDERAWTTLQAAPNQFAIFGKRA